MKKVLKKDVDRLRKMMDRIEIRELRLFKAYGEVKPNSARASDLIDGGSLSRVIEFLDND